MQNLRKFIVALACAAVCVGAVSCKKDKDDDETKPYLSGSVNFKFPRYVLPKAEYDLTPSGVKKHDGGICGYYWTVTPVYKSIKDTTRLEDGKGDGTYRLVVPDTLCTMQVTCVAFAEGYYTSSKSASVVIVNPSTSITDNGMMIDTKKFTDARDGKTYYYETIGNLNWFKKNLAYDALGVPYDDCEAMTDVIGKYYTWNEAKQACPDGWRLPTSDDWNDLAATLGVLNPLETESYKGIAGDLMVNAKFNGVRLWEYWPTVKITNKSGFSAIPTGYSVVNTDSNEYIDLTSYAAYWVDADFSSDPEQALYRYLYVQTPDVYVAHGSKDYLRMPVRCVRNK